MPERYRVTPPPDTGQHGPAWLRWVDRYAHTHAACVETISARDFPPLVLQHIDHHDGDAPTTTHLQLVCTLMARLGAAHGLPSVPITLEDAVTMTQALVLDTALATLRTTAVIGDYHLHEPRLGLEHASPLGAALKLWLDEILHTPDTV